METVTALEKAKAALEESREFILLCENRNRQSRSLAKMLEMIDTALDAIREEMMV